MASITFLPSNQKFDVPDNSKVLAVATKNKVNISFSCGACRCGLCFFDVGGNAKLSTMSSDEKEILEVINQPTNGSVRMACKTFVESGDLVVNLMKNLG